MAATRSSTIVMLGCGGFIGSHWLERILSETRYDVIGIDRASDKLRQLLGHPRLRFLQMDVHDTASVGKILEEAGTVISLAALCNPWLYTHTAVEVIESNFTAIYPVVRLCSRLGCRLIHFSTSEVYGRTLSGCTGGAVADATPETVALSETSTPLILGPVEAQRWCYAAAKQLLERTIFAYGVEQGLDYTIIRPFNFIGPRMDFFPGIDGEGVPRVLACFMEALMRGKPLHLVDGGANRRCFTAIGDAVDALMLILERAEASQRKIFNIGNPANETTIAGLATRMISLYRELVPGTPLPDTAVENVTAREFYGDGYEDSDRRVPDISAITGATGWRPATGLDEALRFAMEGFIADYGSHIGVTAAEPETGTP
jgi:UDP-apiose/xylose synthase